MSFVAILPTLTIQTMVETSLPNLFTDQTFMEDNMCSSIINEHPCVKNILSVLVNHMSDNVREIKLSKEKNLETIEILANQLKKNQDIIETNQEVIENNKFEIKLLKAELKQLKMNSDPGTHSKSHFIDLKKSSLWYDTNNHDKKQLSWHEGAETGYIVSNSTMVSHFMSINFIIRKTIKLYT